MHKNEMTREQFQECTKTIVLRAYGAFRDWIFNEAMSELDVYEVFDLICIAGVLKHRMDGEGIAQTISLINAYIADKGPNLSYESVSALNKISQILREYNRFRNCVEITGEFYCAN